MGGGGGGVAANRVYFSCRKINVRVNILKLWFELPPKMFYGRYFTHALTMEYESACYCSACCIRS